MNFQTIRNHLWFSIIGPQKDYIWRVLSYYQCEKLVQNLSSFQHDRDNTLYSNLMKNLKERFQ
jgi:hypothetical protein